MVTTGLLASLAQPTTLGLYPRLVPRLVGADGHWLRGWVFACQKSLLDQGFKEVRKEKGPWQFLETTATGVMLALSPGLSSDPEQSGGGGGGGGRGC